MHKNTNVSVFIDSQLITLLDVIKVKKLHIH